MKKKKRMTKAEMRVAVAKDVLAQMKFMNVRQGTYCAVSEKAVDLIYDVRHESAQKYIDKLLNKSKPCTVCAKGALFLSQINLFNKVKLREIADGDIVPKTTRGMFGNNNADLIEVAFEKSVDYSHDVDGIEVAKRAVRFGRKYGKKENRLKAIMRNVVKNNGDFKP